jgi:hypothetical protein
MYLHVFFDDQTSDVDGAILHRLVGMMSFMIGLWWLVPASPRRMD